MLHTYKRIVELDRLDDVTAVGLIEGGEWLDVLAVSYGSDDTRLRIRFEQSGDVWVYELAADETMEKALQHIKGRLQPIPYDFQITILRGDKAQFWIRKLVEGGKAARAAANRNGKNKEKIVLMMPNDIR